MEQFISANSDVICTNTIVESVHPEEKYIIDNQGNKTEYSNLIWAGDLKHLYNNIPVEKLNVKN